MARHRQPAPRRNLIESVVVPAASSVVVAAATVRSLFDRRRRGDRPDEVTDARDGLGPVPPPPPDSPPPGRARRALRTALTVNKRYGEIGGNHAAASFTLQAFLSLFPLLLVGIAVLGFVSAGSETDLGQRIVGELGLTGEAAERLTEALATAEDSRQAASLVGLAGLLWSGLGLVGALQHSYNTVWQVKERGMRDKAFGLLWLAGAAVLFIGGAAATTALRWLPGVLAPAGILVTFAVSFALWLWTSRVLPNRDIPWRRLVPGAILGAVGLEVLKAVGAYWVPRAVASSADLYGPIGVVFAVLAWLLLFGRLVVYSAVLNVVLYERHVGTVRAVVEMPPVPGAPADADGNVHADRAGRLMNV